MLDSFLGLLVLGLLTSWIISAVSIQTRLLATNAKLNSREQIDYLRAAKGNPIDPCTAPGDFLSHVKTFHPGDPDVDNLGALRDLLIDPQLMVRPGDQSEDDVINALKENEQYPYTSNDGSPRLDGFLREPAGGNAEREPGDVILPGPSQADWAVINSRREEVPIWLCPP